MRTASILIPLLSLLIIMFIFSEYAGVKETKESVETLKIRAAEEKGSFSFAVLGDSSTVPGCTECQGNAVLAKLVQKSIKIHLTLLFTPGTVRSRVVLFSICRLSETHWVN